MSRTDKAPLGEADARLLGALYRKYPGERFDEFNVAVDAPRSPELLRALGFLGVKVDRPRRALSYRSHVVVARWLAEVEGRPVDGLYLRKDRVGWCYIRRDAP